MNILVTNIYSWKNKGDAAIVLCLLEDLRRQFPTAVITLSSADPRDTGKYGDYPCVLGLLPLLKKIFHGTDARFTARLKYGLRLLAFRWRLALFFFLRRLGGNGWFLFSGELAKKLRTYAETDLLVACGGGYLISKTRGYRLEQWLGSEDLRWLAEEFHLGSRFGKPVILYHQSIGPFVQTRDFRRIYPALAAADLILCREKRTWTRLHEAGLGNLRESADIAFRLTFRPGELPDLPDFETPHFTIGITARLCLPSPAQEQYEAALSLFIADILQARPKSRFYFMPQVIFETAHDNDLHVAERIRGRVPDSLRQRVLLITDDLAPGALKAAISQMDAFVGTRMHSCIFALSAHVPTIAIAYEPKSDGIMEMLGLPDYVLPAAGLDPAQLKTLFQRLLQDDEYEKKLKQGLEHVRQLTDIDLKAVTKSG